MISIRAQHLPIEKYKDDFNRALSFYITPKLKNHLKMSLGMFYGDVDIEGDFNEGLEVSFSKPEHITHIDDLIETVTLGDIVADNIALDYAGAVNAAWSLTESVHSELNFLRD